VRTDCWRHGHGSNPALSFPLAAGQIASYIPPMSGFLFVLLMIAMVGTLVVLFVGLFAMARGGEFNRRYGNRLMRLRVMMQGAAILLFLALILAMRG
jgi:Hypoxia induced protein conserved region